MSVSQKPASSMSSHPSNTAQGASKGEEADTDEEEPVPSLSTTEDLAMRLLNPKVRTSEAEEYASYVDQYRHLNLSNELQYEHSAADMDLYEQAVATAMAKKDIASLLRVVPADEEVYARHIRSVRVQDTRQ